MPRKSPKHLKNKICNEEREMMVAEHPILPASHSKWPHAPRGGGHAAAFISNK